ncbi:MAG: (d)CMP kinase [Acidimicrobiia bacterium]
MSELVIAMDGPAGTGKSTVSRAVASELGLPHLDTGAFYRAAGLAALRSNLDLGNEMAVVNRIAEATLEQANGRMYLDGVDVTSDIRTPRATTASSIVSAYPAVRSVLVGLQRAWVGDHGGRAVVEGRDIGSVVFPNATVKVYLDATPETRARRRSDETGEPYPEVLTQVIERDSRDSTRADSPLIVPSGAHVIDTSTLGLDEVIEHVLALIESRPHRPS